MKMKIVSDQWGKININSGFLDADIEPLKNGNYNIRIDTGVMYMEIKEVPAKEQTNDNTSTH